MYFESFLSIISDWNPTNIVGYDRKVESMSNINISYKELKQLEEGSYQLLDMRDESNTSYGMIPGAVVAADEEELAAQAKEYLDQGRSHFILHKGNLQQRGSRELVRRRNRCFELRRWIHGVAVISDERRTGK